ncbi:MAG TPA: hypothetical protein VGV89_03425 [Thermoplasmata archaeon]|nr:hypothetical protein [Thermoplasmata archaeon]
MSSPAAPPTRAAGEISEPGADPAPIGASPLYLLVGLLLVGVAVAIVAVQYASAPVPPGVDPGDWIQRSFAYVGLPYPPAQAISSPYLYPPIIFPFLGATVLVTGNALSAGFVFGAAILAVYGLASILLARRAFGHGALQVGFVALSVLNGTLLSMLFWGGYPNVVGFVFFDLTVFFFIAFLQDERPVYALGIWIGASLTFLTHSLTFYMLGGALALTIFLLLVMGRFRLGPWIRNRGHQVGAVVLVATVGLYTGVTRALGIPHPNYLSSNPAAFKLDNIGEIFIPFSAGPAVTPAGGSVYLDPVVAFALVAFLGLAVVLALLVLGRRWPGWTTPTLVIAGGWTAAAFLLPAGGYLAHVDTDYSRFAYYLPQPIALLVLGALDRAVTTKEEARAAPVPRTSAAPAWRRRVDVRNVALHGAVFLGVILLLANVSLPAVAANEQGNTGEAHDQSFLQAVNFLKSSPTPGSVLTYQGAARWVEALTARGTYDFGPTWLLFERYQVTNAELAFWATNSYVAVTNNQAVLSYSPPASPVLSQAPMYTIYDEGVTLPILRALPGATVMNLSSGNGTHPVALSDFGAPTLSYAGTPLPRGTLDYQGSGVTVDQISTIGAGGDAWINYTFTGTTTSQIRSIQLGLAPPLPGVPTLHEGGSPSIQFQGGSFTWSVPTSLGQLPNPVTVTTDGQITPAPQSVSVNASGLPYTVLLGLNDPAPSGAFSVSIALATGGTSNPATVLPATMLTQSFLQGYDIHFLLLPASAPYSQNIALYQFAFQYRIVYQNPEWLILQG